MLSNVPFKFYLRRYTLAAYPPCNFFAVEEGTSTLVGRCRFTLSNPS